MKKGTGYLGTSSALLCGLAVICGAAPAAAATCGWLENSSWNVEEGGMVWNRSAGVVLDAIDAVGEYRTHVGISNGFKERDQQWISHATMVPPAQSSYPTVCDDPLNREQLTFPAPGASAVSLGAYYSFLHEADGESLLDYGWRSGNNPEHDSAYDPSTQAFVSWPENSNRGRQVSDWMWWQMPHTQINSGDATFYRYTWDNGALMSYGLYQFRDIEQVNDGIGPAKNNGIICSTLSAYATARSGAGWVAPATYDHESVRAGLQALFNGAYRQCEEKASGVQSFLGCFDSDLCDETAQQVVDCFALGICNDGESEAWERVRDDPNAVSRTISPDCAAGASTRCFSTGGGSSLWGWDVDRQVVFGGGGRVYGCWN